MALELRLDTADVLALRFARSPLWETMQALRVTREPDRQAYHLSWLRSLDLAAVADAATVLAPLVPRPGTQPDFLIPIPGGPTTTADNDLAAVAATPLDAVERELAAAAEDPRAAADVRAEVRALLVDPSGGLHRVVEAQRTCWEHLVRPFWTQIDDLLASDIAWRAAQLATAGLESVLAGLSPHVAWTGDGLR
nr:transcriptional regulator [Pseudonocardiales bacterium]